MYNVYVLLARYYSLCVKGLYLPCLDFKIGILIYFFIKQKHEEEVAVLFSTFYSLQSQKPPPKIYRSLRGNSN